MSTESTETTSPATAQGTEPATEADGLSPDAATASARLPRPRIRAGAVLWGLVLVAAGSFVLWIASSPENREAALGTLLHMGLLDWVVALVVTIGAVITLFALAAVIRRLQARRSTAARAGTGAGTSTSTSTSTS